MTNTQYKKALKLLAPRITRLATRFQPITQRNARVAAESNGNLARSQAQILRALMNLEVFDTTSPTREQLAFWSCAPPTSGGFKNNLGALRSMGYISYPTPGTVSITDEGGERISAMRKRSTYMKSSSGNSSYSISEPNPPALLAQVLSPARARTWRPPSTFLRPAAVSKTIWAPCGRPADQYPAAGTVKVADWLI